MWTSRQAVRKLGAHFDKNGEVEPYIVLEPEISITVLPLTTMAIQAFLPLGLHGDSSELITTTFV